MTPSKHTEERLVRLTICAQLCIHINIHMCIHAYVCIYIYTCIYIHMYITVHIHTYTYIHTHVQHVHMHACKHVWNDGTAATVREAQLDANKLCPSPCPLQSGGGSPSVASSPIAWPWGTRISAEQPQPTAAHHTIMTARRPDCNHSSALVRSRSTQFMACQSCEPRRRPPETRLRFCHFRGF